MLTQNLFPIVKWPNCAFSYWIALIVYAENVSNIIENKEICICTPYLQCLLRRPSPLTCLFKPAHIYPILSIWGIQNALVAECRTTACILITTGVKSGLKKKCIYNVHHFCLFWNMLYFLIKDIFTSWYRTCHSLSRTNYTRVRKVFSGFLVKTEGLGHYLWPTQTSSFLKRITKSWVR